MQPHVAHINISPGGIPKRPIERGRVTFERIEGDNWRDRIHHGLPGQALLLFSAEILEELRTEGYALYPGALGENLTTRNLNFRSVRPGDVYLVGNEVRIRITRIRVPCRTLAAYGPGILRAMFDDEVRAGNADSLKWGRSGFYAEVLREGWVSPGDPIVLQSDRGGSSC
jgi:MOSC domain-containing protein YiiM